MTENNKGCYDYNLEKNRKHKTLLERWVCSSITSPSATNIYKNTFSDSIMFSLGKPYPMGNVQYKRMHNAANIIYPQYISKNDGVNHENPLLITKKINLAIYNPKLANRIFSSSQGC